MRLRRYVYITECFAVETETIETRRRFGSWVWGFVMRFNGDGLGHNFLPGPLLMGQNCSLTFRFFLNLDLPFLVMGLLPSSFPARQKWFSALNEPIAVHSSLPRNPGQFRGQGSRPRCRQIPAVGSAGRTAQIVLSPAILQKTSNLREINPRSKFLS